MFGKAVRTNNDVECWHRRINELTLYLLESVLHDEAQLVSIGSAGLGTITESGATRLSSSSLYSADERIVTQLLTVCAKAHGPRRMAQDA